LCSDSQTDHEILRNECREYGWEVEGPEELGHTGLTKQKPHGQDWMAEERQESQDIEKREEQGSSQRRSGMRCENSTPRNGPG
jgi:hypothetical protein